MRLIGGAAAMTSGGDHRLSQRERYRRFMGFPSSSTSASLKSCGYCLLLLLTLLALLTVAAVLVVLLAVKPKKPQFDLQQASVGYILVSNAAAAPAAYLSLNATFLFAAHNPNGVRIRYSGARFHVMSHGVPLGTARVPGFDQPARSSRLVEARIGFSRVVHAGAGEIFADAAVNDRVEVRIAGEVVARLPLLGLISPSVKVPVDCAIVISPRRQAVTGKQCGGG